MAQKEKREFAGLHQAPVVCWQSGALQVRAGSTWVTFSADSAVLLRVQGEELATLRERIGECPGLWSLRNASFWPLMPGRSAFGLHTVDSQLGFGDEELRSAYPVDDEVFTDLYRWLDNSSVGDGIAISSQPDGSLKLPIGAVGCSITPLPGELAKLAGGLLNQVGSADGAKRVILQLKTGSSEVYWQLDRHSAARFKLALSYEAKDSENVYLSRSAVARLACRLAKG